MSESSACQEGRLPVGASEEVTLCLYLELPPLLLVAAVQLPPAPPVAQRLPLSSDDKHAHKAPLLVSTHTHTAQVQGEVCGIVVPVPELPPAFSSLLPSLVVAC